MEKKHKGAHGELVATVWLLKQGYEVFRNVSEHGDVDIIAYKDGNITLFDVKTVAVKNDGSPSVATLKESQIESGVKLLCVNPFDDGCQIIDNPRLRGGENDLCIRCATPFRRRGRLQKFCCSDCKLKTEAETKARKVIQFRDAAPGMS